MQAQGLNCTILWASRHCLSIFFIASLEDTVWIDLRIFLEEGKASLFGICNVVQAR